MSLQQRICSGRKLKLQLHYSSSKDGSISLMRKVALPGRHLTKNKQRKLNPAPAIALICRIAHTYDYSKSKSTQPSSERWWVMLHIHHIAHYSSIFIPLTWSHGRLEVECLLVVVQCGGQEAQLVHGAAQVVVRLLAAAPQVEVRVEEGASLEKNKHNIPRVLKNMLGSFEKVPGRAMMFFTNISLLCLIVLKF